MPANSLSFFGRMGYWTHMAFYPTVLSVYFLGIKPMRMASNEKAAKQDWEDLVEARKVDPDTFNPFTPVPYHNNPELTYVYAHIDMRNYVNATTLTSRITSGRATTTPTITATSLPTDTTSPRLCEEPYALIVIMLFVSQVCSVVSLSVLAKFRHLYLKHKISNTLKK